MSCKMNSYLLFIAHISDNIVIKMFKNTFALARISCISPTYNKAVIWLLQYMYI